MKKKKGLNSVAKKKWIWEYNCVNFVNLVTIFKLHVGTEMGKNFNCDL